MDSAALFGGSLMAALIAGTIALFAPCCISAMLPAYLAGSFQNRKVLVAMTFVFASGVGTIVLPIALGAQALRRTITSEHTTVYLIGGALMLGLGLYTLLGGQIHLPVPGRRTGGKAGVMGVYSLGLFSGVASSCCAPVLAGVVALSGLASSFGAALALGTAYVFGMVIPLFAIALLWERRDWGSSQLFRNRSFTWKLGPFRRTLTGTGLASGTLLVAMGAVTVWIGARGPSMPSATGWSARLSARLQHYGHLATQALDWIPGWAVGVMLVTAIALLGRRALRQTSRALPADSSEPMTDREDNHDEEAADA
jgi:cytochrome c-type biogenesis protein